MAIGIIGAGKAGTVLGRYLTACGLAVAGYMSRTPAHAARAADLTDSICFDDFAQLAAHCDVVLIATPDGQIGATAAALAPHLTADHVLAHLSGSLTHAVLKPDHAVWQAASLHPIFAFSDPEMDLAPLASAVFSVEGDAAAQQRLTALLAPCGNAVVPVTAADKVRYHAACVMASNLVCGLYGEAARQLTACGFSEPLARQALAPLFLTNARAIIDRGPTDALTGPMERNDLSTVRAHLQALADDPLGDAVYRSLSLALLPLVAEGHPERDRADMEKELRSNHADNGSNVRRSETQKNPSDDAHLLRLFHSKINQQGRH